MHELSIAMNIIQIAEQEAKKNKATAISSIDIEIGAVSGVILEALEFAMETAVKDSLLKDATINYKIIEARAKCLNCGYIFKTDDFIAPCPHCNHPYTEFIEGKELKISKITIE